MKTPEIIEKLADDFAVKIQTKEGTLSRLNAIEWFKAGYTQCQQDNAERELSYKIFELANELAVAGYGNEAVFLHNIRNRMILTTLNKQ